MQSFEYQRNGRFFAQIAGGMEGIGAEELQELGATDIAEAYRGLYFSADLTTIYKINYTSRLMTRVLAPLASFKAHSEDVLYKKALEIPWEKLFSFKQTFAITAVVSHSKIRHSKFAALRVKDAIADYFREKFRFRPSVDKDTPDVRFFVYVENNRATISLDLSGDSLHKRGYRKRQLEAPMQETLGAAIIRLSEWDGTKPLYDPMCGSGTLLSEALMAYCRLPANAHRKNFGFKYLPDFNAAEWEALQLSLAENIRPIPNALICGSDISYKAISAAKHNNRQLMYGNKIKLRVGDFRKLDGLQNRVIVCNPPYGVRMGKQDELVGLYKQLGDFLKQRCQGSEAYIYFGERKLIGSIGLRTTWKIPLVNGALDGRLAKFEIY